jgi:RNA polymerase sigma-70 factor (ECF subfamily)
MTGVRIGVRKAAHDREYPAGPGGAGDPAGLTGLPRPPDPPGGTCDADLIRLSAAEPEQFAALFRRHSGALHRYVARRLGTDAAEDIVAEVFLTAFRQRDRYQPSQPDARPWLYGIATNLIGRHRRAEVRMYRALARTGADPVTEPFTDQVEARVTAAGTARPLAAALAQLPAAHRHALRADGVPANVEFSQTPFEGTTSTSAVPPSCTAPRMSDKDNAMLQEKITPSFGPPSSLDPGSVALTIDPSAFPTGIGLYIKAFAASPGTENGPVFALQTDLVTTSPQCTGS